MLVCGKHHQNIVIIFQLKKTKTKTYCFPAQKPINDEGCLQVQQSGLEVKVTPICSQLCHILTGDLAQTR